MTKFLLLFLFLNVEAFSQTAGTKGAWLPVHVRWKHAPPSINPKLETGSATVLYFDGQGSFAILDCVVNREPGRYTTISSGDGQTVFLGEWDRHLPGSVTYRLVSRTVTRDGEILPGPWRKDRLVATSTGTLLFKGKSYRRVQGLDGSARESLPNLSGVHKQ